MMNGPAAPLAEYTLSEGDRLGGKRCKQAFGRDAGWSTKLAMDAPRPLERNAKKGIIRERRQYGVHYCMYVIHRYPTLKALGGHGLSLPAASTSQRRSLVGHNSTPVLEPKHDTRASLFKPDTRGRLILQRCRVTHTNRTLRFGILLEDREVNVKASQKSRRKHQDGQT